MFSQKLHTEITFLKGVGPLKAKFMKNDLGIEYVFQMLEYFPFRYEDKSQIVNIKNINADTKTVLIKGKIIAKDDIGIGPKRRLVLTLSDGERTIDLVWFRSISWVDKNFLLGEEILAYGKPTIFNGYQNMSHPEIEKVNEQKAQNLKMSPVYSSTEKAKEKGVDSKFIASLSNFIVDTLIEEDTPEVLPANILQKYRLISRYKAFKYIHHPSCESDAQHAIRRFKFEELFLLQMQMVRLKMKTQKNQGYLFPLVGEYFNTFYEKFLPFELTNAQKRTIKEIRNDFATGYQMNRLLQGDVGSGKTIVAMLCMLLALDNGFQACLMAPTEILSQQHYISFHEWLQQLGIEVALLTGSTKAKERKRILEGLKNGEIKIVIGTHALIEKKVEFQNLGFVVIDEQHKFGVAQRAALSKKNNLNTHILVMTATPIPRSLALTAYGHMDVSKIDELPPGRKEIQTKHAFDNQRINIVQFLKKEIAKGRQIYIVYPLIEESEKIDYESLERGYEEIKSYFPELIDDGISLVHGRQAVDLRETNMKRFATGKTKILVATTVIEVGVNVPNASVMVIESSERFGLSQLHQLRGRVGRGAEQSYCILMTSSKISEDSKKRISIMVQSNDGFQIAQQDLEMRGPGDMEGTRQSGVLNLKLANIVEDAAILEEARKTAIDILTEDPNLILPQNKNLRETLITSQSQNWIEVL